ncbi:MAG TPA: PQQ-binding-like beta-propeller repeat protein [Pyrinomonadaceae bacterium]|jgi:outer membrane protein assembly factor BamB
MKAVFLWCVLCLFTALSANAQPVWQASLNGKVEFYQTTDFGIVLAGSDNSLYALDGQTGERLWRRNHRGLDETSVVPVPATDLILVSTDEGDRSRVEAIDLLSGATVWRSDKVKGDVMQLAVDPQADLLAVVLVKKARGRVGEEFKRTPNIHVFQLSSGEELWKKELESDVQMMPASFSQDSEVAYTLDNYRPPLVLDNRLYLFYEGATSFDARTGKEGEREKFKINEGGLALTEADPVFDEKHLYTSGKGKVRAINRKNFKVEWEAKDLGVTPEMAIVGNVLYVRTGGQFTRIKDGEIEEEGSFGVSAIDAENGKTLWRYKGADKGLTNFVFADANTILVADKDDLISIDAKTGKRIDKFEHDIERAQFVLINEKGEAVVGGRDEIAAFQLQSPRLKAQAPFEIQDSVLKIKNSFTEIRNPKSEIQNQAVWRVRHKAPSRGVLRTVAGIALRATALYFRYGGLATSALNIARGANAARSILSLRWSGLRSSRFGSFDLTTLAANSARNYAVNRISVYGISARTPALLNRLNSLRSNVSSGLQISVPNVSNIRGRIIGGTIDRATPSRADVQENLLDRLDPARQLEKLSSYFLRRQRLADLRGNYMYFYTDLPRPFDRKGLVGVNVHTGRDARYALVSEPDARFTTDETVGLLYSADGNRLQAFDVLDR